MRGKSNDPLVAVVAMAENNVIGDGEKLLWRIEGDLPRVKNLTMGRPLIMGRRTYLSIGKPLPGRANIVLTRKDNWTDEGVITAATPDEAIAAAESWLDAGSDRIREIIIFGGGDIYAQFMPEISRIEMTEVALAPEGSAVFPNIDKAEWEESDRIDHPASALSPAHSYVTLTRRPRPTH